MGLETIAILGFSLLQADAAISASEDQAAAAIRQGELDAENRAKDTRLRAARQRASFLNSGLTLEGTPLAVINNTFETGIADTNQILDNANATASNIIQSGRSQAIGTLASAASGVSFGGGNVFGSQGSLSRTIEFGNPNVQGPIQGFGGFGG